MTLSQVPGPRQGRPGTRHLQQLDVLQLAEIRICPRPGPGATIETPDGVVIVSQTCDVVRTDPPLLAVCPLVEKTAEAPTLRKGSRPSFVHVPGVGDCWFADLNQVGVLAKDFAATLQARRGAPSSEELSRASRLIGRKFSRFAFPDDIVPWFKPLESVIDSKHHKESSAEGRMFQLVDELRVEPSTPWSSPPHSLTLCIILKRDVLPLFPEDELPVKPDGFDEALRSAGRPRSADEIAARLEKATDPIDIYWLWQSLAGAWAYKCRPKESDLRKLDGAARARTLGAVADNELAYDLTTVDDFSMYRYKHSEMLDLDYLSPPDLLFGSDGNSRDDDSTVKTTQL